MLHLKTTVMSVNYMRYSTWYLNLVLGTEEPEAGEQRIGSLALDEALKVLCVLRLLSHPHTSTHQSRVRQQTRLDFSTWKSHWSRNQSVLLRGEASPSHGASLTRETLWAPLNPGNVPSGPTGQAQPSQRKEDMSNSWDLRTPLPKPQGKHNCTQAGAR